MSTTPQFQPENTAVAFLFDRLVGFDPSRDFYQLISAPRSVLPQDSHAWNRIGLVDPRFAGAEPPEISLLSRNQMH